MNWITLQPANRGGGRTPGPARATLTKNTLNLTHSAWDLLGGAEYINVYYDARELIIALRPTTEQDTSGYSINGGGNTMYRVSLRALASKHGGMIGRYNAHMHDGMLLLVREDSDIPSAKISFRKLTSAASATRQLPNKAPQARLDARSLRLNRAACALLGNPRRVRIDIDTNALRFRITPTTPEDTSGWSVSGAGSAERRILNAGTIQKLVKSSPSLTGEYKIGRAAGALILERK